MILFNLILVISCIMLLCGIIIKKILNYKHRKFYREFSLDFKFKEVRENGSNNSYYLVSSIDSNYIPRYVIRDSSYEKSIILNYNKSYKYISYYIALFNKDKKIIGLIKVYDKNTSTNSRILVLKNKTAYVNIIVNGCEDELVNPGYMVPKTLKQFMLEQLFSSISLFSFLYIVLYIATRIYLKDLTHTYFTSSMCTILMIGLLAITIIYLIVSAYLFNKASKANKLGEKVYYEFY